MKLISHKKAAACFFGPYPTVILRYCTNFYDQVCNLHIALHGYDVTIDLQFLFRETFHTTDNFRVGISGMVFVYQRLEKRDNFLIYIQTLANYIVEFFHGCKENQLPLFPTQGSELSWMDN